MSIQIRTKDGQVKEYSTVAERLTALHEAGKQLEVLESAPVAVGNGFIWRVKLTVDGLTYVGNAEVHLNSTNFAEKADPWATAETSSVGRALAWCGYAGTPDNPSIASADEVIRVQSPVNAPRMPSQPVQPGKSSNVTSLPVKPSEVEQVRGFVGRVFAFSQDDFETRWTAYKVYRLGQNKADPDLNRDDINALRNYAVEQENKAATVAR